MYAINRYDHNNTNHSKALCTFYGIHCLLTPEWQTSQNLDWESVKMERLHWLNSICILFLSLFEFHSFKRKVVAIPLFHV